MALALAQSNVLVLGAPTLETVLAEATGGTEPYTYTLEGLPEGLEFDAGEREITGRVRKIGVTALVYTVTDADMATATTNFRLIVRTGRQFQTISRPRLETALRSLMSGQKVGHNAIQQLSRYLYALGENSNFFNDALETKVEIGDEESGRIVVRRVGSTLEITQPDGSTDTVDLPEETSLDWNAGLYAPWVYGLLYNNRNRDSAQSTGGGAWTMHERAGNRELPVGGGSWNWNNIVRLTFGERDAGGTDRRAVFRSEDLSSGRLIVALRHQDADGDVHVVAFQQTGRVVDNGDQTFSFPVERTASAQGFDSGTIVDIAPPLDADFSVRLLLPDVRAYDGVPLARPIGWFQVEVSAAIAAALGALADGADWPADAVAVANKATPGPNVPGDTVTLYRGGTTWTRAWIGDRWAPAAQFIDGNLVATGTITARTIAAQAVIASKMRLGPYMESTDADELSLGDIQSSNFVQGSLGWIIRQDGSAEFDALAIRGILAAEHIEPSVVSIRALWKGFQNIPLFSRELIARAGISLMIENDPVESEWWTDPTGVLMVLLRSFSAITGPFRYISGLIQVAELPFWGTGDFGERDFQFDSGNTDARGGFVHNGIAYIVDRTDDKCYGYTLTDSGAERAATKDFALAAVHDLAGNGFVHEGIAYIVDGSDRKFYAYELRDVGAFRQPGRDIAISSPGSFAAEFAFGHEGTAYVMRSSAPYGCQAYTITATGGDRNADKDFDFDADNVGPRGGFVKDGIAYVFDSPDRKAYAYRLVSDGAQRMAANDFSTDGFASQDNLDPVREIRGAFLHDDIAFVVDRSRRTAFGFSGLERRIPLEIAVPNSISSGTILRVVRSEDGETLHVGIGGHNELQTLELVAANWMTGFRGPLSTIGDARAPDAPVARGTWAWNPPSDNGGSSIIRYEWRLDGGAWNSTTESQVSPTSIKRWAVGDAYDFEVRAVNLVGAGAILRQQGVVVEPGRPARPTLRNLGIDALVTTTPDQLYIRVVGADFIEQSFNGVNWVSTGYDPNTGYWEYFGGGQRFRGYNYGITNEFGLTGPTSDYSNILFV